MQKVRRYREYSSFGKLIKKGLIDKDMTATELAYLLKIKPQYLNRIIHGDVDAGRYKERIVELLGLAA